MAVAYHRAGLELDAIGNPSSNTQRPTGDRRGLASILTLAAALLIWLWPIGLGGQMPVGGDVTQFFMGLMQVLSLSLKAGRLPIWNELWGYGFPGLGESQMGVYYPPHLVLYGLLATETAFVLSLLLHTLWAGLGAWWAARRFGVPPLGAWLAAFAFATSGFFVIHMPHPWGYTTGSWLPWAVGICWTILDSPSARRPATYLALSIVLVMQVLAGHFQLAFMTQASVLIISGWIALEASIDARRATPSDPDRRLIPTLGRTSAMAATVALVFPLAAMQVWPTARLARLAASQRDFEYLSGFAASPLHLVSLVAPGLFHRSPLWRPLVWDPLHTSPEETLAYVGLAPFFLAMLTIRRELRRDRGARVLTALGCAACLLSLGPYFPGFQWLILLPGFSFFRAPARWWVVTSLALAILAGKGLDQCRVWPRIGRSLLRFSVGAVVWILLVLGVLELALAGGSNALVSSAFETIFRARPWTGDPNYRSWLGDTQRPYQHPRIPPRLVRSGIATPPRDSRSFQQSRRDIYLQELAPTAGILAAMVGLGLLAKRTGGSRWPRAALVALSLVDLGLFGRHRLVSLGPWTPLTEQSPVLAALARKPGGARVADAFRNLSMLVGLGPIAAYRTLDLPALEALASLARGPLHQERLQPLVQRALRTTGVGLRVLDPVEIAMEPASTTRAEPTIDDSALAGWLFGDYWKEEQGPWSHRFRIFRTDPPQAKAWFVPASAVADSAILDHWNGDPELVLRIFDHAVPLAMHSTGPENEEVAVEATESGWVLITQLADPQWQARWTDDEEPVSLKPEILPTFRRRKGDGGWQRVLVSGPIRQRLTLYYDALDVRQGQMISAGTWLAWGCLVLWLEILYRRRKQTQ